MESGNASRRCATAACCLVALAAGWGFYGLSIAPLAQQEAETRRIVSDLRERIESARKTINQVRAVEQNGGRIQAELERLQGNLPANSAIVSAPALVREHFARFGIAVSVVRLNTTQDEPAIPGHQRGFWSVALPLDAAGRNIVPLLLAVADLDQEKSGVRVLDFAIRQDPVNPGGRVGLLSFAALVRP